MELRVERRDRVTDHGGPKAVVEGPADGVLHADLGDGPGYDRHVPIEAGETISEVGAEEGVVAVLVEDGVSSGSLGSSSRSSAASASASMLG